ncbi:MAG: hypothetical protein R6V35_00775 [Candidatus Nanohaloarchaea archaeon]
MNKGLMILPFASVLEFFGVLTLLTNESSFLPVIDLGFQIPVFLVSANIQGVSAFIMGSMATFYAVTNMDQA